MREPLQVGGDLVVLDCTGVGRMAVHSSAGENTEVEVGSLELGLVEEDTQDKWVEEDIEGPVDCSLGLSL